VTLLYYNVCGLSLSNYRRATFYSSVTWTAVSGVRDDTVNRRKLPAGNYIAVDMIAPRSFNITIVERSEAAARYKGFRFGPLCTYTLYSQRRRSAKSSAIIIG